ncbi:hypothetical protein [Komagataeibacter sp. FNDCR2]|uniref:hypothetical protein n=1 Tax=Komagataeibacter sp. FNDCR2 TaxID=2878682 RepID=UPI001E2FC4D6|nr:hypothetical protein [Komagataeibacter sp. FNDCR2]MCE2575589.1 hypothetical protein [Komagataeibacter sp. FNDCR2]
MRYETGPVHRSSVTLYATMAAVGLLLAGCAPQPGRVVQPNMRHLVPVNRTLPPELANHAPPPSDQSPPAGQEATP